MAQVPPAILVGWQSGEMTLAELMQPPPVGMAGAAEGARFRMEADAASCNGDFPYRPGSNAIRFATLFN